jgi:addiction module RelB/DinJ family antitoxin
MAETVIRSRINSAIKLEAQTLLEKFGLTMSEAIRLFLHQVVIEKGLPFQVKLPIDAAQEHDRWFRSQVEAALKEANDPTTEFIPHETVRSNWAEKKKALKARASKEKQS